MNISHLFQRLTAITLTIGSLLFIAPAQSNPLGNQVPQIPAFLPNSSDVPMSQPLPIDGEWSISSIGKRIRIEGGRAYAVDPWVHLFVLQIQPSMVVMTDMKRTGVGTYVAKDLPLAGEFRAVMQRDGSLDVSVAGAFGPVKYKLIPVRIDDREAFALERAGELPVTDPLQQNEPDYGQEPPNYPVEDSSDVFPPDPDDFDTPVTGEPQTNPDAGEEKVTPW